VATGEVWRAATHSLIDDNEQVNTFHFKMKSSADPVSTIGDYLTTEFVTLYAPLAASPISWDMVQIRRLSVPAIGGDYTTGYPINGSGPSGMKDLRTAALISLRTGFLGRSYRGRLYLPAPDDSKLDLGVLTTTMVSDLETIFDDILAGVGEGGSSADLEWGVWSAKLGDIVTGGHITGYDWSAGFFPINAYMVRNQMATQRRRGLGIGA